MIRHIVFFSARNPGDTDAMLAGLRRLGEIPHAGVFEVLENTRIDPLSDEIDAVVYAEFADQAALAAWKAHPVYAECIRIVRPLRELRYSVDVVSSLPATRPAG
ncbi:stress responsive protein [Opitutaceae bacterium TAV5]|nr:stress responsive protein [Opitutaceae bacterium TAV5]